MRAQKLYRLHVTLPPEADAYDWEPEGWEDYMVEKYGPLGSHPDDAYPPFHWPGLRNFLSRSGAERRAWEFQRWGATVEIEESEPVAWGGKRGPVRADPRPEVRTEEAPSPELAGLPF